MDFKAEFIRIYQENIKREGADKLLEYLINSDFFTAPASTKYHASFDGGLAVHSVDVYWSLDDYLGRPRCFTEYKMNYSNESAAIVSLLHDVCKICCYNKYQRNVKENGQWVQVDAYEFDDPAPYGHGEKSVFLISKFMKLTNEEAFAIRYHMGFSDNTTDARNVGKVFEKYPLALALHVADMEASYYMDDKMELEVEFY